MSITIYKCISQLIKNCSLMIVIDFSSVILDAYLLKKPIINISVKNNGYGIPTAFSNNSCMMENLKTLENSVMKILEIDNSYLIENSIISSQNYISKTGNDCCGDTKICRRLFNIQSTCNG